MKALSVAALLVLVLASHSYAQYFAGCANQGQTALSSQLGAIKTTGNPQMNNYLQYERQSLQKFFGVNAAIILFQDTLYNRPNACVSAVAESDDYPDGAIAMGFNYLHNMYSFAGNFSMIPMVAAHQFAHLANINLKATPLAGIYSELYADFMAGCYVAFSSNHQWIDVNRKLRWILRVGDYAAINNPHDHGTPDQRAEAFKTGFEWCRAQKLAGSKAQVNEASKAACIYLNLQDNRIAEK